MEQQELRQWEWRCIEENPPWCAAACPLHLDARALCGRVAAGDWPGAWKVLLRTMPLPGVLGRLCDAPCRARCQRGEAGEAIAVNLLERACVGHARPRLKPAPLPARQERVAVLGSGLAGLTACFDLLRKGYQITLHEPAEALADGPRQRYANQVPPEAWDEELALLKKLGLKVELAAPLDQPGFLDQVLETCDGVFLSLDALDPEAWPLEIGPEGAPLVASPSQATTLPNVFAGGLSNAEAPSPVWAAAQGRWGATSLDRYLKGVSPTAGRENDGPFETRLFTSLAGVEPSPMVEPADPVGYSDDEAAREAARCLQCHCLECVKVCPYLESFGAYPKKYARAIYNNQSIVMGARQANKLINSCSLCGLCEVVCPEGFAMQDLCLATRQDMVRKGKMPPSAHEFALLDMEFSLGPEFRLARHQPSHAASAALFFPGCQLAASAPSQVRAVYDHLCASLEGGVGLMLACCGAPALWAGREDRLASALAAWQEDWQALGAPPLIMACSSCAEVFRRHLPEVEQRFLWEVLAQTGLEAKAPVPGPLAVHDPCTTRHQPAAQQVVREVVGKAGAELSELATGRELTECCGYGGLMSTANPELGREVISRRGQQSPLDFLAYCAVCRDRLAQVGKRALHALDLFFPVPGEADPAARPSPGWSQRRENRARLRTELARDLWGEEEPAMEAHREVKLIIGPEVAALLEERRILIEDLQKVIYEAEQKGNKLCHPQTGHFLAAFRPYKAMFWVEYTPEDDGYRVHNAYAHRMRVKGGGQG